MSKLEQDKKHNQTVRITFFDFYKFIKIIKS